MKLMIISDIHGDIYCLNKVLDIYAKEHCSKLLILGDLFSYGFDFDRDDIINRLNLMKESIVCVRGNCDNNISNILFDMPYIERIKLDNNLITMTHGHLYTKEYLKSEKSNIILTGHTHRSNIENIDNKLFINPGSVSNAREGENSFCIIDEDSVTIRNLDNITINDYKFGDKNG